jgi:hypothetical protein
VHLFLSPADAAAHDLTTSSTYYTNNIPFALLTEVKNQFPTLFSKGIGNRKLQDFDELNELLASVTLVLPSIDPIDAGRYAFVDATLTAKSIVCSDLSIQDLQVSHRRLSNTQVTIDISIAGLAFDCGIDWALVRRTCDLSVQGRLYFSLHILYMIVNFLRINASAGLGN